MGGSGSKQGNKEYLTESLGDHTDAINCVAISDDQSLLATGSEDKTIRMWSTKTEYTQCLGELRGHTSYITCLDISGSFIISGSADNSIRKWDMTTCECVFNFMGHGSRISRVMVGGPYLFSTSYDKTAKVWLFDAEDEFDEDEVDEHRKACRRTLKGHEKGVYSMVYIPSVNALYQNEVEDMDLQNFQFHPEDLLITGSADFTAKCWILESSTMLRTFKGHKGPITCLSTDANGRILFSGSSDCDIRSWDIKTARCLTLMAGHEGPVTCITVVNRLMYSGSQDGLARCWVTGGSDSTRAYKGHKHSVAAIIFHNGILYTASGDTCARAYDAKTGTLKRIFEGHDGAVTCLTIVGQRLYTGSYDSTLRVWDISTIHENNDSDDEEIEFVEEDDVDLRTIPTNPII